MRERISIALASVLKPVNDVRMFEKFALSLGQTNKYEVNIIGFEAKNNKKIENIHYFPVFNFNRISIGRLFAPMIAFRILFKVKPSVIIFNTPEILPVIVIYKILTGCKIIYDIQENYFRNIVHNRNYPRVLRWLLGNFVLLTERLALPFIDRAIFAEPGYSLEMPLWNRKAINIKNTYRNLYHFDRRKQDEGGKSLDIVYTGTIAENYGIFEAVRFIDKFHSKHPTIHLVIAGFCASKKTLKELKDLIEGKEYIKLIGGNYIMPHEEIIRIIQQADFGIICYNINPSVENCFPTKIYEYMANRLPIIIQNYKPWSAFCIKHHAAIEVDFEHIDYDQLFESISSAQGFYRDGLPEEIYWEEDEKKLIGLMDEIQS